jgi:glyoxylase-like metal-dependent hydrolase (beta-lactamase superfamily II)/rhodanese-related sulfurtransferase
MSIQIKQFEDKNLSQYSYAVLVESENEIVLIDPARDPQPYLDYAKQQNASITAIIETHPHADFVSGHAELKQITGAPIFTHSLVGALYEHTTFDEGTSVMVGQAEFISIHTPGHSPDSICILLEYSAEEKAVFTGDTLFIGDCGRPDLREGAGNVFSKREDLARQMYHSLREKLMVLNDDVVIYPAHGAGTLCGKSLSAESSSTIGIQKQTNWSLQDATEEEFVKNLLSDQPFVPAYFPFDVELNRKGAASLVESISHINIVEAPSQDFIDQLDPSLWIVDLRDEADFKQGHLAHAINLMASGKLETWLGSMIMPGERFYLAGESVAQLNAAIKRVAAIGYETAIVDALVISDGAVKEDEIDIEAFRHNFANYTIVDVRNETEVKAKAIFPNSISIPLHQLRSRLTEIPSNKPIVVHCAGGYRSAAASSLIHAGVGSEVQVFDLSEAIKDF